MDAEEGAGGAPDSGAEIALQPLEKPLKKKGRQQCPRVQVGEHCGGAGTHTAQAPHARASGGGQEGGCSLWRACPGAGPWQDLQPLGEKTSLEQCVPDRLDPAGQTHARAVPAGLSTVIMLEQRKIRNRKGWQRWSIINWCQLPCPCVCFPAPLERGIEELGMKLSLGEGRGWGKVFSTMFLLLPYSIFNCQLMKLTCWSTTFPSHVAACKVGFCYQHSGRCPSHLSAPWTSAEWREWSWRHSAAWACWNEWRSVWSACTWTTDTWSPGAVTSFWNQRVSFAISGSPRDPVLYYAFRRPLKTIICEMMCSFCWHKS